MPQLGIDKGFGDLRLFRQQRIDWWSKPRRWDPLSWGHVLGEDDVSMVAKSIDENHRLHDNAARFRVNGARQQVPGEFPRSSWQREVLVLISCAMRPPVGGFVAIAPPLSLH